MEALEMLWRSTGGYFLEHMVPGLMPEDEVLLCLFAGAEAEVRAVSERAGLPFERILACVGVGWRTGHRRPPMSPLRDENSR